MRIDAVNNLKPAAVTPPAPSPARSAEVVAAPVQAADPEALNKAVKEANEIAAKSASGVEFSIDKDSGQTVIRAAIVNHRTEIDDIERLVESVIAMGAAATGAHEG